MTHNRHQTKDTNRQGYVSNHGGNIYKAALELDIPENAIIDFSASINPLGISDNVKDVIKNDLDSLIHYPDPDTTLLRQFLAEHHGIASNSILCGNGSTELIYLLPRALKPEKVLITSPTFSEYEKACRLSHASRVTRYRLPPKDNFRIKPDEFIAAMREMSSDNSGNPLNSSPVTRHASRSLNMAFLCNPNNPTGRVLKKKEVLEVAEAARELKCVLIIDEAFIDFIPGHSAIKEVAGNPYLIVLRSMTKFHALTGLRIGYAVISERLTGKVLKFKEPWTVNSLAQKAALAALGDTDYNDRTMHLMKEEKVFLEYVFKDIGVSFIPSDTNYYLLKIKEARKVHNQLMEKGIMVRDCSNFRGLDDSYIRVAVKSRIDNKRLLKEMASLCKK